MISLDIAMVLSHQFVHVNSGLYVQAHRSTLEYSCPWVGEYRYASVLSSTYSQQKSNQYSHWSLKTSVVHPNIDMNSISQMAVPVAG